MESAEVDVLVVGGGPAGMTLVAALHRHGIQVRIVDKDDGPIGSTRAPVLWQRTQEILAAVGIRDLWVPESDEMREESLHFYGKAIGENPVLASNSPYPKPLFNGQNVTERILAKHLADVGKPVEYGKEATAYTETLAGADVIVCGKDGEKETIHARWVVAAEGSKSVVKKAIGLDFEGEKYEGYRIHIADVAVKWTYATPVGQTFFFIEERGYMGGQRLPGDPDRFYFYILTEDDKPDYDGHDVSVEEIQRLVRKFSGDQSATITASKELNTARYKHGVAAAYRKGHAMLIGDTARIAPPLYGQGMNYAMHDAWNLAWKLAFVVKGFGPEALLDTFSEERHKLGTELDKRIDNTFRFITEPKPFQAAAAKTIGPLLLSSDQLQHHFGQQFTEMDITYAGVGLAKHSGSLGKLEVGWRAPALWVKQLPKCSLLNLLELYDGNVWTLLVVTSSQDRGNSEKALLDFASEKQANYRDQLQVVELSCGPQRPDVLRFTTLVDAESRFTREHDLPATGLLLVRPDGHIAWAAKSFSAELNAYLTQWLG